MKVPPRSEVIGPQAPSSVPSPNSRPERLGTEHIEVPWTGLSILVIVLSLILFMAIPGSKVRGQQRQARAAELIARQAERQLNLAIREYRHDHGDWPGLAPSKGSRLTSRPEASAAWLKRQLCLASNERGEVSPSSSSEYHLGPYILGEIPINPLTGLRSLRIREADIERDGAGEPCGWIYDPLTGEVQRCRSAK